MLWLKYSHTLTHTNNLAIQLKIF